MYVHCVRQLGLDVEKVNVNGGAIALGHPLDEYTEFASKVSLTAVYAVITLHWCSADRHWIERAASEEQEGGLFSHYWKGIHRLDGFHAVQVLVTSMCIGTGQGAVRNNSLPNAHVVC